MTPEELMKPRFKVIADYPGSPYKEGAIIKPILKECSVEIAAVNGKPMPFTETYSYDKFPHLFRLLSWYEERKAEDMPEYVQYIVNGYISKLTPEMISYGAIVLEDYLPVTHEQYINPKQ